MKEFQINSNEADQRLDKYLKKLLPEAGSSFIYKMLRKKNITLNGKKADGTEKLNHQDKVKLFLSDDTFQKFAQSQKKTEQIQALPKLKDGRLPYEILYETKDILIINKPAGVLSQKAEVADISANEYILSYILEKGELTESDLATFRPSVCNRLDRNTSGILIAGKTLSGLQEMSEKLKTRTVQKYYLCLVKGNITESRKISAYLSKDETTNKVTVRQEPFTDSKKIETEYVPVRQYQGASLIEIHLLTGRTHQIRAHLSSIGHPILGDYKYGDTNLNNRLKKECRVNGQLLHAAKLILDEDTQIVADLPVQFQKVEEYLSHTAL